MNCAGCGHPFEIRDKFCGNCGTGLTSQASQKEPFIPLPSESGTKPQVRRKNKRKKFKRSLLRLIGSLVLVGVLIMSFSTWYALSQFDSANTLSEVPDEIHLTFDDGDSTVALDTSPAQLALAQPTQQFDHPPSVEISSPGSAATPMSSNPEGTYRNATSQQSSGITILLMGVDAGDSEHIDVGVRPDSLSVLRLNPEDGTCRLLGIPRDSRVNLPGYGLTKVNHALAVGGVPYQQLVVEQYLGIEIDHYGLVDFEGVVGVVDSIGGITVVNPGAFIVGGHHFAEGDIEINGDQALAFARYRGGSDGDFGRIDRQQLVIRALLSELGGMDAVRAVPSLLEAADGHFKTDLSPWQLVSIANEYRSSCTASTLETRSLTGAIETHLDPLLNANLSYVSIQPQDLEAGLRWLLTGEEEPGG